MTIAASTEMGQQRYEDQIQQAMRQIASEDEVFRAISVTSLRSRAAGGRRVPRRLTMRAPLLLSRLAGRVAYGGADLVHRFDLRLPAAWGAEVVTIHDLPPLRFDDEGELPRSAATGARRARAVIVPSEFARREVVELLGVEHVNVIPYGLSPEFVSGEPASDDELQALGVTTPFVLHAAGATARKNLAGLADAWGRVAYECPDLSLVLSGPPDRRRDEHFRGAERVMKPGRLDPRTIAALMRRASAVVVPSTYEGFGLPALEGMACGACVVTVSRGALPEVCGDAALLVEPDAESIAAGILRVLREPGLAGSLRERGPRRAATFSWERAAREHLRVYRRALGSRARGGVGGP